MKSWILSFIVFLIGAILCKAVEDWTADMFPNPQEEPERCGRSRKSFICDPDHILSQDDANTLDGLIEDVFEKTKAKQKAPCAYNGYRIGIALVTKIKATDRLTNTSLSTNAIQARQMLNKLIRSRVFATNVKKAWHLGQCGEDVLIIFSVRENVVYTACGIAAKKKLNNAVVYEISEKAHPILRHGDIFRGLMKMVKDYSAVFGGTYVPIPMVTFGPLMDFVISAADSAHTSHAAITTSLSVALVAAVLAR